MMIDDDLVKSIIANGGWCEVNHQTSKPVKDQLTGRIVLNTINYLVIQRFNPEYEALDGVYLFFKPNIKKLTKAYWIKKYLAVCGKKITNTEIPKAYICSNWLELLRHFLTSYELIKFKLQSSDIYVLIKEFTATEIKVLQVFIAEGSTEVNIRMDRLTCIEAGTKEILQASRKARKLLRGRVKVPE